MMEDTRPTEFFNPSRETIAFKRNLMLVSAVVVVGRFLGVGVANLPYFGMEIAEALEWKVTVVVLMALGYFGFVYWRTFLRDYTAWNSENGIANPAIRFFFRRRITGYMVSEEIQRPKGSADEDRPFDAGVHDLYWDGLETGQRQRYDQLANTIATFRSTSALTDIVVPALLWGGALIWTLLTGWGA